MLTGILRTDRLLLLYSMIFTELTRINLAESFQQLTTQSWQSLAGVQLIEADQAGPELGIMIMTHGNEPAGLAAAHSLLAQDALQKRLLRGRVYLILNNLAAGQRYFEQAQDLSFTADYRFVDQDMNRIPANLLEETLLDNTETRRVKQLLPLYQRLDYVLDLHSTSAPSEPMLIEIKPETEALHCPGVKSVIRNILPHLNGRPLVSLCNQAEGFVLETGSHESPKSRIIAQQAVWSLLEQLEMISPLIDQPGVKADVDSYRIYQAVIFPDESYSLKRLLNNFEYLPAGTAFAAGDGATLVTQQDSYVIMPPPRLKPHHPGSEFLYLATKETTDAT